ncbi:MAG TPA: carbamoyltransferase C-terminal domain-containing protein [Longimicrobiales bacterium]|nr:carbamoyltransferase C-terminal domain-containing protein [Longimicrobiales bacterium]
MILGINTHHPDASAVLLHHGVVVAAVEEERLRRVKHWSGFPALAVRRCLEIAGALPGDIAHIAIGRDPRAHLPRRLARALRMVNRPAFLLDRLRQRRAVLDVRTLVADALGLDAGRMPPIHAVEHHTAHLSSAFYAAPFDEAAVCALDAFGDFVSTSAGMGRGTRLDDVRRVWFPHSLGVLYTAVTQFLGFREYGDEFKLMGLAAHGRPSLVEPMRRLVHLLPGGSFRLDTRYFSHADGRFEWSWEEGAPHVGDLFSSHMETLLGPRFEGGAEVTERMADLAASLQAVYEDAALHVLSGLAERTGTHRLCLAGGCALNSLANGRIPERTPFTEVFVQPAAGDAGTALGAAYHVHHTVLGRPRAEPMRHAFLGPEYAGWQLPEQGAGFTRIEFDDDVALTHRVAAWIAEGRIVGWHQGRLEWGPRALGSRSILADPRRADMRDRLNRKIKYREPFRPFAMSILAGAAADWVVPPADDPFMVTVRPVLPECRERIPAVVHADGTSRIQAVSAETSPLFHRLIEAFAAQTGVPLLLNTSFNESEPIVDTPEQALDCFLRTGMDVLVIGRTALVRQHDEG